MKYKTEETKWVIMDKDRTVIAKGTPRNRHLVSINDIKDKKRVLYYNSEGMARNGYSTGFYSYGLPKEWDEYRLEPVEVILSIIEK